MSARFDYDEAKGAAEMWFAELDSGVTGRTKSGGEPTVESACREYVEDRRREKGDRTAQDADKRFERTVYGGGKKRERHRIADVRLKRLRSSHIREWRQSLVDAGLCKASVNRTQISLCAALNLAVTHKMIGIDESSAWRDVKPFKGVSKRRDLFLDLSQRRALLAASKGALHQLISAVMLTGARAGELVSARAKQFDARTQTITVTGKTGTRPIVLSEAAVQFFSKRADQIESHDFLLVRDDGKPWAHSDWDELVRAAAKEAKLPAGVCLYTLRHSLDHASAVGWDEHARGSKIGRDVADDDRETLRPFGALDCAGTAQCSEHDVEKGVPPPLDRWQRTYVRTDC